MARKGSTQLPELVPNPATTPPPDPDLIDRLTFEHRQLQRLWSELQLAHRRHLEDAHRPEAAYGSTGQQALGRQIVRLLAQHDAVEHEALYPATAAVLGTELADHASGDQADVRDLLGEVDGENLEDEAVFQIFTEALTKLLAHIDEEERIIFPMLRAVLPGSALGSPVGSPPPPPPSAGDGDVDVAAAEREGEGGRKDRLRRRLLRR